MTNEKAFEIMGRAIKTYGEDSQMLMAIEEMSELTKEICKWSRTNHGNRDNIAEEIADVTIMLSQLGIMCGISAEVVADFCEHKLTRLEDRLNGKT